MGSSKIATSNSKMAEQKKSLKEFLKNPFRKLFNKKDKRKKDDTKNTEAVTKSTDKEPIKVVPVVDILSDLKNLKIKEDSDDDDEFSNFTCKVVDDKDRKPSQLSEENFKNFQKEIKTERNERKDSQLSENSLTEFLNEKESRRTKIDSQTSEDSGFSEKTETVDSEGDLSGKKKKIHTVVVARAPIRQQYFKSLHPYTREADYRQISQVNYQTFSGGQVIVAENTRAENSYLDQAIELVDTNVKDYNKEDADTFLQLAEEFIIENTNEDPLLDFLCPKDTMIPRIIEPTESVMEDFNILQNENPVEDLDLASSNHMSDYDTLQLFPEFDTLTVFPTPPRSENIPSPFSDSPVFYPNHSESSWSPHTQTSSPMYLSDYERCQDIPSLDDYPSCITDSAEIEPETTGNTRPRERIPSSSMTMKQYKDLQKEIASEFSKMECCQIKRKSCKEIFEGYISKIKLEDRKVLCQKVANFDLKCAYGVLQQLLEKLARGVTEENLQMALFTYICEKVLALQPELFVQDFGLSLLKSAVLRCPKRPLLTRYLVHCIRIAMKSDKFKPTHECVFTEVDILGDNLLIACARGGDTYANALYELVARNGPDTQLPLFTLHHANSDGHNALHVACLTHSAQAPRTHTVHVLLEHAGINLWGEDVKGGETALHLAVNSANCDLKLIMVIFKHIDRKQWKKLAHTPNRSSVSPLEYARSASKSTTKQNFPEEVLEFLKKCR